MMASHGQLRLPRRTLLLSCLAVLVKLLFITCETTSALAPSFLPRLPSHEGSRSALASSVEHEAASTRPTSATATSTAGESTSATPQWLQNEIEQHEHERAQGASVIDNQCVVGPKHVLVYDTTLRGMI